MLASVGDRKTDTSTARFVNHVPCPKTLVDEKARQILDLTGSLLGPQLQLFMALGIYKAKPQSFLEDFKKFVIGCVWRSYANACQMCTDAVYALTGSNDRRLDPEVVAVLKFVGTMPTVSVMVSEYTNDRCLLAITIGASGYTRVYELTITPTEFRCTFNQNHG